MYSLEECLKLFRHVGFYIKYESHIAFGLKKDETFKTLKSESTLELTI